MLKTKKIKTSLGKNIFLSLILLILLIVLIFFVKENLKTANKRDRLEAELKLLEQKASLILQNKENSENTIIQNNTEEYLERVAREELNLKQEGESVVAFPVVDQEAPIVPKDPEQQGLWQKIMDKIR